MFWKSISATLPPQFGSGFFSNCSSAFRRKSRIQTGSPFIAEISATTSLSSPRRDLKMGAMSSWKPYFSLYPSRMSSACSFMSGSYSRASGRLGVSDPHVALRLQLVCQLRAARLDDPAVDENVDELRLDVIEDPLVVRDQQHAQVGSREGVHALRDDAERVDVEPGVGLVEHRDLGPEHGHLEDLGALLLAAREAVVDVASGEGVVHLE